MKEAVMGKLAWIPITGSILGALLVGLSFVADEGSDHAAIIALGIALSVIPYVLLRAFLELKATTN